MSLDFLSNLSQVIQQVSKDKGVSQEAVINSVVQGVLSAVRKKYGTYRDIEVKYNTELGDLELFEFKKVVSDEEFEDELIEIKYSSAKELDPGASLGDQIGTRLELKDLGRIDAQAARQIIIQHLRDIEREIIFNEFEKRKGEVASGVVRRVDPAMIVVDLEKTEAYIPRREQIPGEQYKAGDRIQGYLKEVRQTTRGPQIIMSRAHEQYLIKLFEAEVPEVAEGIVKIVAAAREPGHRAKMSVYSTDPAVHPVGSCVGIKGSRVQNITQELKGERVDVIVWENDPVQYVCNALAPAKIAKVLIDEDQKQMQIIVPDDQLSLAIGKKGQNVRLAVKLTGWHLNLISEQESKQAKKEALFNLSLLPDISETTVQSLFQYGYTKATELAEAKLNELQSIPGFEKAEEAKKLIQSAKALIDKYAKEGKELPKLQDAEESKKPLASSLKEQAEEILKRELAQLEGEPSGSSKASESQVEKEAAKAKAKAESKQAEAKSKKVEAGQKQAEAGSKKTEVESKEAKAESKQAEAKSKKVEAGQKQAEAGSKKTEVESKEAKAESKQAEARSKKVETEQKQAEAGSKKTEVESKEAKAESKQAEAKDKQVKVGKKQAVTGNKQAEAESKEAKAASKPAKAEDKQVKVGKKQAVTGNKQVKAGTKQAKAEKKQAQAGQKTKT